MLITQHVTRDTRRVLIAGSPPNCLLCVHTIIAGEPTCHRGDCNWIDPRVPVNHKHFCPGITQLLESGPLGPRILIWNFMLNQFVLQADKKQTSCQYCLPPPPLRAKNEIEHRHSVDVEGLESNCQKAGPSPWGRRLCRHHPTSCRAMLYRPVSVAANPRPQWHHFC